MSLFFHIDDEFIDRAFIDTLQTQCGMCHTLRKCCMIKDSCWWLMPQLIRYVYWKKRKKSFVKYLLSGCLYINIVMSIVDLSDCLVYSDRN